MGVGAGAALGDETLDAAERSAQLFALKFTDLSTTAARCSPRSLRACAGRRTAVTRMCVLPGSICAVGGAVRRRLRRGPPLSMVATPVAIQSNDCVWKCGARRCAWALTWAVRGGPAQICFVWGWALDGAERCSWLCHARTAACFPPFGGWLEGCALKRAFFASCGPNAAHLWHDAPRGPCSSPGGS